MGKNVLTVKDLKTFYKTRLNEYVYAVDGVSFDLRSGEILGIAGESGCGKSTLSLSLMGYYFPPLHYKSGVIEIDGTDIMKLKYDNLRVGFLGTKISYIPQAAMNALNPTMRVINFIQDIAEEHKLGMTKEQVYNMAKERFLALNLPERTLGAYPNELSGGMKQRTVIAISAMLNPEILIADEPTSALDVTTQKVVIKMMKDLMNKSFVKSIIFITHELPLLRHIADRIIVMYAGQFVEMGTSEEIIFSPLHPYSKALMGSIIVPEKGMKDQKLSCIPGAPPNLKHVPEGCRFADRCLYAESECRQGDIEEKYYNGRMYKCIFDYEKLKELYGYEQ